MARGGWIAGLAAVAALSLPATASADAIVSAEGNFLGGLAFDPAKVEVSVGESVFWTNTDFLVPHTATEDHNLWDLGGDYGATPINSAGFGPGETVSRPFDAGTFAYHCRVHGPVQSGVVAVPVRIRVHRTGARWLLHAVWGSGALPDGQVFDVQRKRGKGPWRLVADATSKTRGRFAGGATGTQWSFRARVREQANETASSGWSPPATVSAE